MKWYVEYITPEQANILIEDVNLQPCDHVCVGMAFPPALAKRIVELHNADLTNKEVTNAEGSC